MNIQKIASYTVICFLIALGLLIFYRIHFAVDYYDETFYIGMTYHYLLGGKPFVDELSIAQATSLLLYPAFYLFYWIHHSPSGIVLFSRVLYFTFTLGIFCSSFLLLKKTVDRRMAMLIAFIPVSFTLFYIYGLSYNTMGSLLLLTGIIFLFYSLTYREFPLITGLLIGGACFNYFPFTILALFLLLLMWIYNCSWKFMGRYFLGLCILASILAYFLISAGFANLEKIYQFSTSLGVQGGGILKLSSFFQNMYHAFPYKLFFVFLFGLAFIIHRQFKASYFIASCILIFTLVLKGWGENNFMIYLSLIGLLAPLLYLFIRKHPLANRILLLIWLPGFIGGLISAWASGNGWYNSLVGGLSMPIATFLFLSLLSEGILEHFHQEKIKNVVFCSSILFMMFVLIALTRTAFNKNYGDKPNDTLHEKITSGSFKGLYTTPEKSNFLLALQKDVASTSTQNKSILFFDDFPAGYLLSTMKPHTNTIWLFPTGSFPKFTKSLTLAYFQNSNHLPDVIVKIIGVADNSQNFHPFQYQKNDSFLEFIQQHYHPSIQRENYVIYLKNSSAT